jgi:hypothetical protein
VPPIEGAHADGEYEVERRFAGLQDEFLGRNPP